MERHRIARLLPEIFQRTLPPDWGQESAPAAASGSVLGAFLAVMESLHAPTEHTLAHLDTYFDPRLAPEEWLPFLSLYLDLDRFLTPEGTFPGGPERLRALVLAAVSLARERGTHAGLVSFLEIATGISGITVETIPERPYHIVVICPAPQVESYGMTLEQLHTWLAALVAAEKPAYVTCEVHLRAASGGWIDFSSGKPVQERPI